MHPQHGRYHDHAPETAHKQHHVQGREVGRDCLHPICTTMLYIVLQEYVKKLGACLLDGKQGSDGGLNDPVSGKLNKWAAEATSLMMCMALRNPWAVRAFNAAVDASQLPGRTCAGQWQNSNLLV